MDMIERAARALCARNRRDPDQLEPGNCPYSTDEEIVDGQCPNGDPGFFKWRLYVDEVRLVLTAIAEPTYDMQKAAFAVRNVCFRSSSGLVDIGQLCVETEDEPGSGAATIWRAMIDAILEPLPATSGVERSGN